MVEALSGAFHQLGIVVVFRSLPYALYALVKRRWTALPCVAACAVPLLALDGAGHAVLALSAVGLAYFAAGAVLTHWISKQASELGKLDALVIAGLMFAIFLLVPATLLRPISLGTFLFLGWELTLKAYGYVLERGGKRNDVRSCLFFFLVDPTLVLPQRARRAQPVAAPRFIARMLARACAGVAVVGLAFALEAHLPQIAAASTPWFTEHGRATAVLATGAMQFITVYAKGSGVASLQLGLLGVCGYTATERYRLPLLAVSPADFWTRWNTYVGQWASRYIYLPISLGLTRAARRRGLTWVGPTLGIGVAVIITFLAIGAFHDLYIWLERRELTYRATTFFGANALLILGWAALGRVPQRLPSLGRLALGAALFWIAGIAAAGCR